MGQTYRWTDRQTTPDAIADVADALSIAPKKPELIQSIGLTLPI